MLNLNAFVQRGRLRPQVNWNGFFRIAKAIGEVPIDLDVAVNTFQDPSASSVHLEHELLADRLHALLPPNNPRVWDSEHAQWTVLAPDEGPPVRPQDAMILINSRKHLPDLVERLRARNIPSSRRPTRLAADATGHPTADGGSGSNGSPLDEESRSGNSLALPLSG